MYTIQSWVKRICQKFLFQIELRIHKLPNSSQITYVLYFTLNISVCKTVYGSDTYLGVSYSTKQLITHVYTNFAYFMLEHACYEKRTTTTTSKRR